MEKEFPMSVYLVTFELRSPDRDYQALFDALNAFTHCQSSESIWFIRSDETHKEIRDNLRVCIDPEDQLFVSRIRYGWAAWNMTCADWIHAQLQ